MKVKDYGDMLGKVQGKPCIVFECFGSYSGDWVAVLDSGRNIELWKGYYGSCSGCDFLEAEKDTWQSEEISDEKARNFFKEDKAFLTISKQDVRTMTLKEFNSIFPANVRKDMYDFEDKRLFDAVKLAVK